jgi:hypothetical protein
MVKHVDISTMCVDFAAFDRQLHYHDAQMWTYTGNVHRMHNEMYQAALARYNE